MIHKSAKNSTSELLYSWAAIEYDLIASKA